MARRRLLVGIFASVILVVLRIVAAPPSEEERVRALITPPPSVPGGKIFPFHRVVAYYGAPQDKELGELGIGTPDEAAKKLLKAARPYASRIRPVIPAFELLATVASSHPGDDGMYRTRQPPLTIQRYLDAARRAHMMLILDIQPGHANFLTEAKLLEPYLKQPDVSLALDPEWHLPVGQIPGQAIGSVTATDVNQVANYLNDLVVRNHLPQKLLLIHSFTDGMIQPKFGLVVPPNIAEVVNIDGVGTQPVKRLRYTQLTARQANNLGRGFKLFYHEDKRLMTPLQVLRLQPPPDVVVYE